MALNSEARLQLMSQPTCCLCVCVCACFCPLQTDTNNAPSPPSRAFLFLNAFFFYCFSLRRAKLLGTCFKRSRHPLINTSESAAGSRSPRARLSKKKKKKLPAAEISCISQTISPAHYALRCLLGDG